MIYYFTYFFTKCLSFCFFPRTIKGWEHVPKQGAYILASNHISNLDPVILGISTPRRLRFMAKIELFKSPIMDWWLKELWAFPVKRGQADLGALKQALRFLKQGDPVLMFPEGTRRIGDEPVIVQSGVGFLAIKSGVPIVPVLVQGSQHVMPPGSKFLKRSKVSVQYGQPFSIPADISNEDASQQILDRIFALK